MARVKATPIGEPTEAEFFPEIPDVNVGPTIFSPPEDPIKMLIHSPPGHGKTTLIGSAVGDRRVSPLILLEFEGGTRSIRSKVRKISIDDLGHVPPELDKVHSLAIRNWSDFDAAYDFLANYEHGYMSVGLDSLSEMNYLNMNTSLVTALKEDRKHDVDILEQRDYLRSSNQMRKLVRAFRDLPMHVFITAHSQQLQDPRTKEMKLYPSLTGKLAFEIPGLMEIVGYLAIVEFDDGAMTRRLFVQPTGRLEVKDRTEGGKLGEYVDDPTLPKLMDLIEGE